MTLATIDTCNNWHLQTNDIGQRMTLATNNTRNRTNDTRNKWQLTTNDNLQQVTLTTNDNSQQMTYSQPMTLATNDTHNQWHLQQVTHARICQPQNIVTGWISRAVNSFCFSSKNRPEASVPKREKRLITVDYDLDFGRFSMDEMLALEQLPDVVSPNNWIESLKIHF